MMNNCFICSRESYDFERHGGVSKIFTSYNVTNDCDIILGKKMETWTREILDVYKVFK